MTPNFFNSDNQHQIIVSIIFNNITEEFRVLTESRKDERIKGFEPMDHPFIQSSKNKVTYNITTKSYKIDTKKHKTWGKVTFSRPPESTILAFIENSFKNPPAT